MRTALFVVLLLVFIVCSCDERVEFIGPPAPSQKLLRKAYKDKRPSGQAVQYAILINGAAENRFFADLSVAYQVLLESGFLRENIYILDAKEQDWHWYPIDGRAMSHNIVFIFHRLKQILNRQDMLFVLVTDHDNRIPESRAFTIQLVDRTIDQKEFARHIDGLNPKIAIFLFDQCYSGGFAKEIGNGKNVAVASTLENSKAHSMIYDIFRRVLYARISRYRNIRYKQGQQGKH